MHWNLPIGIGEKGLAICKYVKIDSSDSAFQNSISITNIKVELSPIQKLFSFKFSSMCIFVCFLYYKYIFHDRKYIRLGMVMEICSKIFSSFSKFSREFL